MVPFFSTVWAKAETVQAVKATRSSFFIIKRFKGWISKISTYIDCNNFLTIWFLRIFTKVAWEWLQGIILPLKAFPPARFGFDVCWRQQEIIYVLDHAYLVSIVFLLKKIAQNPKAGKRKLLIMPQLVMWSLKYLSYLISKPQSITTKIMYRIFSLFNALRF